MGLADDLNAGANFVQNLYQGRMQRQYAQQYPQLLQDQVGMANNGLAASNINLQTLPQMNQADLQKALITNQYLPQTLQGNNLYKQAMANYMGGQNMQEKGMSNTGKVIFEMRKNNLTFDAQGNVVPISSTTTPGQAGGGLAASPLPPLPGGVPAANAQNTASSISNGPSGLASPSMPPSSVPVPQINNQPMQAQDATLQNIPPSTNEITGIANTYGAAKQKLTSDPATRQKAKYAVNIQKTFDEMDPSIFQTYSGINGLAQLKADQAQALAGKTSPQYEKFNNFTKVKVPILVDQIRQFYGTSIQPEMIKQLEQLSNPITWNTNPQLALSQFNSLKQLLGKEMATYQDTLNAPIRPYQGSQNNSAGPLVVSVIDPQGRSGKMPAANLEAALKAGYKKV